jgi:hypothetical protein
MWFDESRTIDNLKVTAHGVALFQKIESQFYNQYLPESYGCAASGGCTLRTPDDEGALFINFALHPGSYQPSGHINVSRAREFYIDFESSFVGSTLDSSTVTATFLAEGVALNFLLVSDGSAVLRYST